MVKNTAIFHVNHILFFYKCFRVLSLSDHLRVHNRPILGLSFRERNTKRLEVLVTANMALKVPLVNPSLRLLVYYFTSSKLPVPLRSIMFAVTLTGSRGSTPTQAPGRKSPLSEHSGPVNDSHDSAPPHAHSQHSVHRQQQYRDDGGKERYDMMRHRTNSSRSHEQRPRDMGQRYG